MARLLADVDSQLCDVDEHSAAVAATSSELESMRAALSSELDHLRGGDSWRHTEMLELEALKRSIVAASEGGEGTAEMLSQLQEEDIHPPLSPPPQQRAGPLPQHEQPPRAL